jgi:hypothetical protein
MNFSFYFKNNIISLNKSSVLNKNIDFQRFINLFKNLQGNIYSCNNSVFSGQPKVEKGQSAELNHVSNVSSSCVSAAFWHFSQHSGARRATVMWPHAPHV